MNEKWSQFANEYVVSLFPTYMLPEGLFQGTRKWLGTPVNIALKIEDEAIVWYFKPQNWKQGHLALVKKIQANPEFLRNIYREMEKSGKLQIIFAKKAAKQAANASNKKLNGLYQKFVSLNTRAYGYGLILPLLDYQDTTFLSDELHAILKKRGKDNFFNLLTTPLQETNVKRQELELLGLYAQIRQKPGLHKLLQRLPAKDFLASLAEADKGLCAAFNRHAKKFCWVYYVYQGPAASPVYFVELLKDLVEKNTNPRKNLVGYAAEKALLTKQQKQLLENLGLSPYERKIVLLARDGVFYKALRRELQSCSYYHMEAVLKAIGKKLDLSLSQVRLMLAKEVEHSLHSKQTKTGILNQRAELVYLERTQTTRCLSGKQAARYLKVHVKQEKLNLNVTEAAGTVAYPGKVKGTVKIINSPKEMGKMRRGDILVAQTTNPNLMPAIRQAAAIVTDEGGLTCHAAIVSRELKIPCVVGVKIASKFLKDGLRILVDAQKGIVKKL